MGGKTLLCVLGGGGHTREMLELIRLLGPSYNYEYIIPHNDKLSEAKLLYPGKVFRILNPREKNDRSRIVICAKMFVSAIQSISILFRSRASVMFSCGAGIAVAPMLIGKLLFGKKISYIESIARVSKPSLSGKLVYPFADIFFVQWPQLKKSYPGSIYAGRVI